MNAASQWRLKIARRIVPVIARNAKVRAVMVGGSTARGCADSYSDLEIGVFWSDPPDDAERMAPIQPCAGVFWELDPYDPEQEIWMEEWGLNELKIDMRNLLVSTAERFMIDVVERYDPTIFKQNTLAAIHDGIPLHGSEMLKGWQARLTVYPRELTLAVLRAHMEGELREWCWWVDQLISRGDLPLVYTSFGEAIYQILSMLMGLNGIYHMGTKWMNLLIARMELKPQALSARIEHVYRVTPGSGLKIIRDLLLETYALIESAYPELQTDVAQARAKFLRWRKQIAPAPE